MSPEAQRVAIAEACGWKRAHYVGAHGDCDTLLAPGVEPEHKTEECNGRFPIKGLGEWLDALEVPSYLTDLNAMHEAEKAMLGLTISRWEEYGRHLHNLAGGIAWRATAAQRAEAFLRTLNLWTDK